MRPSIKLLSALAAILLIASILPAAPREAFENALEVDLSTGKALIEESLIQENNHYYKLTGIRSGKKLRVEVEVRGISSTYLTVVIYSSDRARIAGREEILGAGHVKKIELEYAFSRRPGEDDRTVYLRFGKLRGAFNYTAEISLEPVADLYPGNPEGDAGESPSTALKAPEITSNATSTWTGYLSSSASGEDYEDCYELKARLSKGDVLSILIQPSESLRIEAALLSADLFPLRSNRSELAGKPASIRLSGEWEDKTYTFYLKISNLGGAGGEGFYTVKAWVEKAEPKPPETSAAEVEAPLHESTLRLAIIAAAIALVAASIIILVLRRRAPGVEEVGWWGEW